MQTLDANPNIECDCCETLQVTCFHTHQPNYYSDLHVMLYFLLNIAIQSHFQITIT